MSDSTDGQGAGGAGSGGAGGGAGSGDQAPAQLKTVRGQLAQRTQELETVRGELETFRAKAETAETLSAEIKRLKAEIAGLGESHATERALWQAGITDPDEVELVKFAHGRQGDKAPKLGDWVAELRRDPTKAPKILQPVTSRWSGGGDNKGKSGGNGKPASSSRIRPNRTAAVVDDEGARSEPTAEDWAAARRAALAGDRRPLDTLRERTGLPVRRRGR